MRIAASRDARQLVGLEDRELAHQAVGYQCLVAVPGVGKGPVRRARDGQPVQVRQVARPRALPYDDEKSRSDQASARAVSCLIEPRPSRPSASSREASGAGSGGCVGVFIVCGAGGDPGVGAQRQRRLVCTTQQPLQWRTASSVQRRSAGSVPNSRRPWPISTGTVVTVTRSMRSSRRQAWIS